LTIKLTPKASAAISARSLTPGLATASTPNAASSPSCDPTIHARRRPIGNQANRSTKKPFRNLMPQGNMVAPTTVPTCATEAPSAASHAGMANVNSPMETPCAP
jgi:hypothetical protein